MTSSMSISSRSRQTGGLNSDGDDGWSGPAVSGEDVQYNYGLGQLDFFLLPQVPRQELVMRSSLRHEPQACCQEAALTRRTLWRRSEGGVGLGPSGKQPHPATPELTAWQERLADSSQ